MALEWNKVTWYSKLLAVILFVLTFYIGFNLCSSWGEQRIKNNLLPSGQFSNPEPTGVNLSQLYSNSAKGFSIRYPSDFTVDDTYKYQELGPGKDISGVKFTIPLSMKTGTNLGSDSYVSVEEISKTQTCTASLFLDQGLAHTLTDRNIIYSVASSTGAGAGNRYEETVYATPITNGCLAIRYFIHYGVLENYPLGTVKQFDKQALLNQFDTIRHSLIIL